MRFTEAIRFRAGTRWRWFKGLFYKRKYFAYVSMSWIRRGPAGKEWGQVLKRAPWSPLFSSNIIPLCYQRFFFYQGYLYQPSVGRYDTYISLSAFTLDQIISMSCYFNLRFEISTSSSNFEGVKIVSRLLFSQTQLIVLDSWILGKKTGCFRYHFQYFMQHGTLNSYALTPLNVVSWYFFFLSWNLA